jgi:hypothetical protein
MSDLDAFLRWNSGHLLENRTRGAYAEWLVHRALGLDPGQHRVEWAEVDVTFGSITLEVKSAAFVQSWQQTRPSTISFPIEQRTATAYVFCLLAEQDPELVNPQELSQWRFWVVPTAKLHGERRSIGLQPLHRSRVSAKPLSGHGQCRAGKVQNRDPLIAKVQEVTHKRGGTTAHIDDCRIQ